MNAVWKTTVQFYTLECPNECGTHYETVEALIRQTKDGKATMAVEASFETEAPFVLELLERFKVGYETMSRFREAVRSRDSSLAARLRSGPEADLNGPGFGIGRGLNQTGVLPRKEGYAMYAEPDDRDPTRVVIRVATSEHTSVIVPTGDGRETSGPLGAADRFVTQYGVLIGLNVL